MSERKLVSCGVAVFKKHKCFFSNVKQLPVSTEVLLMRKVFFIQNNAQMVCEHKTSS